MSDFKETASVLDGKVKTDFDPKWQNLEPQKHELTNISTSDPHYIRFSVTRQPTVEETERGRTEPIEIGSPWVIRFPTRDAADSHKSDIHEAMRTMRGEPDQAWSDVARLSKCPNPSLLPKFKNLQMELVPAPQPKPEPIPRDHPAYPGSFRAHLDAVTGQPHEQPGPTPPAGSGEAGSGPQPRGPRKVRSRAAPAKAGVPAAGRGRKAAKSGKKQGRAKKAAKRQRD
jgi:hypothetical protein